MNKSLILVIILCILAIFIATTNTEPIHDTLNNVKTAIQGEANQEPIDNITDNTTNNKNDSLKINTTSTKNTNNTTIKSNVKTYDKNGIYFQYPSYWNYDELNKLFSLYQKEYLSRWDDGMIFYIENKPLKEELTIQQETERYKHPKNITIDGKKAYSLKATKGDYWQYLILVEKNNKQTYITTFYCDQDLKKQDKELFDEILSTMKLN